MWPCPFLLSSRNRNSPVGIFYPLLLFEVVGFDATENPRLRLLNTNESHQPRRLKTTWNWMCKSILTTCIIPSLIPNISLWLLMEWTLRCDRTSWSWAGKAGRAGWQWLRSPADGRCTQSPSRSGSCLRLTGRFYSGSRLPPRSRTPSQSLRSHWGLERYSKSYVVTTKVVIIN